MLKTLLAYALSVGGMIGLLVSLAAVVAANINYAQARYTIVNMLRSQPNNAELMMKQAPATFFEPLHVVMKTLAMIRSNDPAMIAKASGPTYDGTVAGVKGKWTQIFAKAKLAGMAVGGGLAVGLSGDGFPIIIFLVALAGGFVFLWMYLRKLDLDKSLVRARAEVLPEVEAAFIQNRYVLPPPPV